MEQTVSDLIDLTDLRTETTPNTVGHQGDYELSDTGNSAIDNQQTCFHQEGVDPTALTTQHEAGITSAAVDTENGDPSNMGRIPGETRLHTGGACHMFVRLLISSFSSLTNSCITM